MLQEYLGGGGSGVVYKGIRGEIPVAVKILPKNILDHDEQLARFQREAKVLARIEHPNIVEVLDMGSTPAGIYFIVMRYFPGENLQKTLEKDTKLSVAEAVDVVRQVAYGMVATHALGLIHRDLKPSNILYNRKEKQVKVVDFGLAREVHADQMITQQGYIVGTPNYMSPEQCQGLPLDGRSDIYNLGIVLYQLVAGRLPFHKLTTMQTFLAHINEPLNWTPQMTEAIPSGLRKVIGKMMAKEPRDRYGGMADVVGALSQPMGELLKRE